MLEHESGANSQTRMFYRMVLILILCLAFAVRLHNLQVSSFWSDELHSWRRASQQSWSAVFEMWLGSGHGPVYEWGLLHNWMRLGGGEFFLRFPLVAIGVINTALIFVMAKSFFRNDRISFIATLVFALASLHIYYSREIRPYALDTLFASLSLLFFYQLAFSKTAKAVWPARIGYLFFAALTLYTHYTAGFLLVCLAAWGSGYALIKRDWAFLRDILLLNLLVVLLFSPWLGMFRSQVTQQPYSWIPEQTWVEVLSIILRPFWHPLVLGWLVTALLVIVALIGLILVAVSRRGRDSLDETKGKLMLLGGCFLGPILIGILLSTFWHPFMIDRYYLYIVPPASLLAGYFLFYIYQKTIGKYIAWILLIGVLVSAVGLVRTSWTEDWRGLTDKLARGSTSDSMIVLLSGLLLRPFNYYYAGEGFVSVLALASDVESVAEVAQNSDSLWVVRPERFPVNEAAWQQLVDRLSYDLVYCETFGDYYTLDLCLYSR